MKTEKIECSGSLKNKMTKLKGIWYCPFEAFKDFPNAGIFGLRCEYSTSFLEEARFHVEAHMKEIYVKLDAKIETKN